MDKGKSLRLHPEHGVNPTICKCFWCGRETGSIALLGLNGGQKATKFSVVDYDPCDDCRKQWTLGIVVAEAQTTPVRERQPPIGSSANPPAYPTGRWCVIRRESFYKVLNPDSPTYAAAMANGTVVCTKEVFDHLCPPKLIRDAADAALARMDVQGNA